MSGESYTLFDGLGGQPLLVQTFFDTPDTRIISLNGYIKGESFCI